jgi:hypothetical protein
MPEGLTELIESYYIHAYSLLQGKGVDQISQQKEHIEQSFHCYCLWRKWSNDGNGAHYLLRIDYKNMHRIQPTREAHLSPSIRILLGLHYIANLVFSS